MKKSTQIDEHHIFGINYLLIEVQGNKLRFQRWKLWSRQMERQTVELLPPTHVLRLEFVEGWQMRHIKHLFVNSSAHRTHPAKCHTGCFITNTLCICNWLGSPVRPRALASDMSRLYCSGMDGLLRPGSQFLILSLRCTRPVFVLRWWWLPSDSIAL